MNVRNLTVRSLAAAGLIVSSLFGASAHATEPSQLYAAANTIINKAVSKGDAVIGQADLGQVANLLAAAGQSPSTATAVTDFAHLIAGQWQGQIGDTVAAVTRIKPLLTSFLLTRNAADGLQLGQVLLPYLDEGGYCSGDPTSDAGAICSFTYASPGASAAAEHGGVPFKAVSLTSVLGQILSQAAPLLAAPTPGTMSTAAAASSTPSWTYAGVTISTPYAYSYIYRWKCSTSCRASVAAWGAITGKYLSVGSDMVFAAAAAAKYCDFSCISGAAWEALNGRDYIGYLVRKGDNRTPNVQEASQAIHALLNVCLAEPAAYNASPAYLALSSQNYDLPYDLGQYIQFGTSHQVAPTFWATNPNLYPQSSLPLGITALTTSKGLYWRYDFTALQAWNFDIMFAAVANADVLQTCTQQAPMSWWVPGATVSAAGNQFWMWSGAKSDVDHYGFKAINAIFGFTGGQNGTGDVSSNTN